MHDLIEYQFYKQDFFIGVSETGMVNLSRDFLTKGS